MNTKIFKKEAHKIIDLICDYYDNIENLPVKSQSKPNEILNQIPDKISDNPTELDSILNDFNNIILPGLTHWQSPGFQAYFTSNTSIPSILAEFITASLGIQGMIWETSPACAELEQAMMNWLKELCGLPSNWEGVIHDTASTSTLIALLTAREKATNFQSNKVGLESNKFTIYISKQTHSSIEKAVKITGLGKSSIRTINVDENFSMQSQNLETQIKQDIADNFTPLFICATLGTTSSCATDPINEISELAKKYNIWLHIDAAFAGTAMIIPEMRKYINGIEDADSYVFNPHKWMFTNFDCSAYFIKDKEQLIKTFEILPEYLKTNSMGEVNDYRDWGIALGRRFRALKLWFVMRYYGKQKLIEMVKNHIYLAEKLKQWVINEKDFEIVAPVQFALVCLRYAPKNKTLEQQNKLNKKIIEMINKEGTSYLTHTVLNNKYTIRVVCSHTYLEEKHLQNTWSLIKKYSKELND